MGREAPLQQAAVVGLPAHRLCSYLGLNRDEKAADRALAAVGFDDSASSHVRAGRLDDLSLARRC